MIKMKILQAIIFLCCLLISKGTMAGPYTDSAHGNSNDGVNRTVTANAGYAKGNCAHCHEQHASIGGSEPEPSSGSASSFCLFADNFSGKTTNLYTQADNFCFYCHCYTDANSLQTPGFANYNYSRNFGGYTTSSVDSIYEAFNQTSYHNLYDIREFAKTNFSSFFKSDSNPCVACHNVHIAKKSCGMPGISFDPTKSAISRPSDHKELWGDDDTERMDDYTSNYQPPFCYNSTNLEPDCQNNDRTLQAGKTPDYVSFCTDCHNATNTIYSHELGRNLYKIDWETSNGDKHGKMVADTNVCLKPPYGGSSCDAPPHRVLSCLDCHEPHGSSNVVLIRKEINKEEVNVTDYYPPLSSVKDNHDGWRYLCQKCHYEADEPDWIAWPYHIHHASQLSTDVPYPFSDMSVCPQCHDHDDGGSYYYFYCTRCHFHGGDDSYLNQIGAGQYATGRRTF